MSGNDQVMLMLGEIKGELVGMRSSVASIDGKIDKIDGRLQKVETRSSINGAISGSVAGVGVSLLAAKVKTMLGL